MPGLPDRGIRGSLKDAQDGSSTCRSAQRVGGGAIAAGGPRALGIARVTVRKYLEQAAPIRQAEAGPRARPVWDVVGERVQAVLADSVQWTGGKQRLTATRLHALVQRPAIGHDDHRLGKMPRSRCAARSSSRSAVV
jgi:hypothetical protein